VPRGALPVSRDAVPGFCPKFVVVMLCLFLGATRIRDVAVRRALRAMPTHAQRRLATDPPASSRVAGRPAGSHHWMHVEDSVTISSRLPG
jgi:hypothetical protein